MKKTVSILLSLIMLLSVFPLLDVSSFAETSGDWEYTISNNEAIITKYKGSTANLTIPSKLGGCKVTSIGSGAFYCCTSLTSVTISNGVTSIGSGAFYKCTSLTSVTIPNSVTSIGSSAFSDCTSLTNITIPNSVTSIGTDAFKNCTSLTSVSIPDSVTSIGGGAFNSCTSLTGINVDSNNQKYCSVNGVLFNKDKSILIQYPAGKTDKEYKIPDSVLNIEHYAFMGCSLLKSIIIPNSFTSIVDFAFYGCSSLTSITIPDSVTSIGKEAFADCTSLTSVTISNGVTIIDDKAFADCTSLTSITIPDSVISIGWCAFFRCTSLESITLPNSITIIDAGAFEYCTSLTSVTIPNSVTSIGGSAFSYCSSLTSVTIGNSVTSISRYAFSDCISLVSITLPNSVTIINDKAFAVCTSLTSITIPDSVTSIGEEAFADCTSLTSITIPDSVTSISWRAFSGCTSLTSVTIGNNVTSIGYHAFGYTVDYETDESKKIDNLVIYGYKGSEAEAYAKKNEIKFVDLNHEHTWGTVTYKWSSDNKTCTATRTCLEDSSHVETETATATSKVTKEPTTTSTGKMVYTAEFKNEGFKKQTKTVTLDKLPDTYKGFPDVKKGDWYYDVVKYVAEKGFITGYQNGNFGPNDALKRQDFVCILARIDGADLKAYENVQSKLTDVKKGDYYAAAVNWAVDKGYISGYKNGKFGVNDPITREQVATILYNYMNKPEVENAEKILAKFPDANKVSSFAKTPVAWAVSNGIISGMGDGTVASTSGATRAQIAAIIQRMDTQGMFSK